MARPRYFLSYTTVWGSPCPILLSSFSYSYSLYLLSFPHSTSNEYFFISNTRGHKVEQQVRPNHIGHCKSGRESEDLSPKKSVVKNFNTHHCFNCKQYVLQVKDHVKSNFLKSYLISEVMVTLQKDGSNN